MIYYSVRRVHVPTFREKLRVQQPTKPMPSPWRWKQQVSAKQNLDTSLLFCRVYQMNKFAVKTN